MKYAKTLFRDTLQTLHATKTNRQSKIVNLKFKIAFVLSVFFLLPSSLRAQNTFDTRGTDFWMTFGNTTNYLASEVNFQIRVVACEEDANVSVTFTAFPVPTTFTVRAGQSYTHTLNASQKNAIYNTQT